MPNTNQKLLDSLTELLNTKGAESFCKQLNQVVKSQGGFTKISREASRNRESLYKALSGKRDPRFSTILDALAALGMKLRVEIDKESLEEKLAGIGGFEGAWLDLYLMSPEERLKRADNAVAALNELSVIDAAN